MPAYMSVPVNGFGNVPQGAGMWSSGYNYGGPGGREGEALHVARGLRGRLAPPPGTMQPWAPQHRKAAAAPRGFTYGGPQALQGYGKIGQINWVKKCEVAKGKVAKWKERASKKFRFSLINADVKVSKWESKQKYRCEQARKQSQGLAVPSTLNDEPYIELTDNEFPWWPLAAVGLGVLVLGGAFAATR